MTPRTAKIPKPAKRPAAAKEKLHPVRYFTTPYALFLAVLIILPLAFYWMQLINEGLAFQGPSSAGGVGTGALGLDSNNNLSVGTSTPISDTKLFVLGSSTASTGFVVKVVQPGATQSFGHSGSVPGSPLLLIRNDGKVGIAGFIGDTTTSTVVIGGNTRVDGVVAATSFTGAWTGTVSAGNVSAGNFAANTGGGNFGFPGSLAVGTASAPTQRIDVVGGNININGLNNSLMWNGRSDLGIFGDNNYGLSLQAPEGISINIDSNANGTATPFTIRENGTGFGGGNVLLSVLENGTVGIGNASPTYGKVSITAGSDTAVLGMDGWPFLKWNTSSRIHFGGYNGSQWSQISFWTSGAENLILDSSGNLGVGGSPYTGTGVRSVTVNATSYPSVALQTGGTTRGMVWGTAADFRVEAVGALPTIFYNNSAETMRILSGGNVQVGENAAYGDVRFAITDTTGDNDATFLTVKRDGTTNPVFSVLPWDGQIYLSAGVYYSNGAWVHNSDDGNNQMLVMDPGSGARWYASNNSSGSWNVASSVQLWDDAGNGTFPSLTIGGGTGKINAGTIDPIYTINGVNYATYMAGMTGVKEETTGTLQIPCEGGVCRHVIDFASVAKGSDLWLFAKASDLSRHMGQMAVILSPAFEGKAWYEKSGEKLLISARPEGGQSSVEVSYRLTAPRFDAEQWSNYNNDIGAKGFVIND